MKLKFILFLVAASFVFAASAQRVKRKGVVVKSDNPQTTATAWYKIEDLQGYWKEIERASADWKNISFTDTILLKINGTNSLTRLKGTMNMDLRGAAMIEAPNYLNISADRYTIEKAGENNLTLRNEAGHHIFIKIKEFPEGIVYDNSKPDELTMVASTDPAKLQGEWEVYRRDAEPGYISAKTTLIKIFNITNVSGVTAKGNVGVYDGKNILNTLTATYNFVAGKMIVALPNQTLSYDVFEATENTLVFGKKGELVNYARKK